MSTTRKVLFGAVAVVAVVAISVGGWWFFIRDEAPKKANIEDAGKTLEDEGGDSATPSNISGTWTIDDSVGSFDDFSGNFVGYRIEEELASIGGNTAAGRTPDVTGDITVDDNEVTAGSFDVNMTTLQSDESLRDNAMKSRGLQTEQFPQATFKLTQPITLPDNATAGDNLSFDATGDLTLHGVTKSVTIPLEAKMEGDHIAVTGSTPIKLADYQIEKPEGLSVVSVADDGSLEFQLFFKK